MEERGGGEEEERHNTSKCGSSNGDRPSASTAQTIACVRSFVRSRRYLLCACSPLKDPTSWVPPTDSLGVIFHTGDQGGVGGVFFFGHAEWGPVTAFFWAGCIT